MKTISKTPKPPYYAVVFTTIRTVKSDGYKEMARRMVELASKQEGFLGMESATDSHPDGPPLGITVSYWESLEAIGKWQSDPEHIEAQKRGQSEWYASCKVRISKVEHEFGF